MRRRQAPHLSFLWPNTNGLGRRTVHRAKPEKGAAIITINRARYLKTSEEAHDTECDLDSQEKNTNKQKICGREGGE